MKIKESYLVKVGSRIEEMFLLENGTYLLRHEYFDGKKTTIVYSALSDLSPAAQKSVKAQMEAELPWEDILVCLRGKIEVIPSENYQLVLKDENSTYHYWNHDGSYDGHSKDVL